MTHCYIKMSQSQKYAPSEKSHHIPVTMEFLYLNVDSDLQKCPGHSSLFCKKKEDL